MTTLSCKNPAASASYFDAVTPNNYFQNHSSLQQVSITKSDSNGIETTKSVQVTSWRSSPPRSLREKTTCLKKERVREAIKIYYCAPTSRVRSTANYRDILSLDSWQNVELHRTWFRDGIESLSVLKNVHPAVWNLGRTEWGTRSNLK